MRETKMLNLRRRILFTILSGFVLSACGVWSICAQPPPSEPRTLTGRIKWKKEMGLLPSAPGSHTTAENICAQFYVVVQLAGSPGVIASDSTLAAKTNFTAPDEYDCRFEMTVPNNRDLVVTARMGDASLFLTPDWQPIHYTLPWIAEGGSRSVPPRGFIRTFVPASKQVT
ncbi:MAG: hypothetical protein ABJB40_02915, partial [Acidobacteriota bacterium]